MRYLFSLFFCVAVLWAQKPSILLLKEYKDQDVAGWLMSEKLDGIRAYWNGKQLLSRGGKVFAAPVWFTKGFPPFAVDGELWTKHGDFEHIQSIVMQQSPHDGWREVTYNIFEVPHQHGGLQERLAVLEQYLLKNPSSNLKILPQWTCKDNEHLQGFLSDIIAKGGEGVVVRDPHVPYIDHRTDSALKVKPSQDAECEVTAVHEGKGKYKDKMGSFTCKRKDGVSFKIGTGLSDNYRQNPFALGTIITYKYQGLTKHKKPRFPVFLRVRKDK